MPRFSSRSKKNKGSCHPLLAKLLDVVIIDVSIDFIVVYGHRSQEEQFELFKKGREKKWFKWEVVDPSKKVTNVDGYKVMSHHNYYPSLAFDIVAWVNGKVTYESKYYIFIAGYIMAKAKELKIPLTWGGDFDNDGDILEKGTFRDLGHFELPLSYQQGNY